MLVFMGGDSTTQQNGFGYSILAFIVYAIILFLLSIITTIANQNWFKKYWYINVLIFVSTGLLMFLIVYATFNEE